MIGLFINVGMWFERFVIICTSLARDFLPSSWHYYVPTPFDYLTLAGSFGLFFTLFLLFCRYLPMVAMSEVKAFHPSAHAHADH
jgi:molybdopterin-containing oxidoreductase family membrane subunit